MPSIPGKACGSCSFCCKVLEIAELAKSAGARCVHCASAGGCAIYPTRPEICRVYECLWKRDRGMSARLRPDRVGTLLMEDPETHRYQAVSDPARPLAWRHPLVFTHLVAMARAGRTVVAKAGLRCWRIHATGEWGPSI